MANDHPTSLRMGFGYRDARAAGLGGIRADRSPRQYNKIVDENKAEREALNSLREAAKDPEWIPLIEHRVAEKLAAQRIANEIAWTERYTKWRARGYSIEYCLRHHWRQAV